jgi:hypothetical protein
MARAAYSQKDLLKRLAVAEDEIRRLKLRTYGSSGGGGGGGGGAGGAWCELGGTNWVPPGTGIGFATANQTIISQSGEFTQVDPQTITVPHGTFFVEWIFEGAFRFATPPPFLGNGWSLWSGGPDQEVANHVKEEGFFEDNKVGTFSATQTSPSAYEWRVGYDDALGRWSYRGAIKSEPVADQLRLTFLSIAAAFTGVMDWSTRWFPALEAVPTHSYGAHFVKIEGVLDA